MSKVLQIYASDELAAAIEAEVERLTRAGLRASVSSVGNDALAKVFLADKLTVEQCDPDLDAKAEAFIRGQV